MMSKRKHIIIGAGPAALSAVEKIRSLNQEDEIKVVSRENALPYCPAILPYVIAGRTAEDNIWLRGDDFFRRMGVDFAGGKEVVKILPEKQQVVYGDGGADRYDSLLIAAGAEPISSAAGELGKDDVLRFHTLDDCRRLGSLLDSHREVTILGAGLVAVELAVALVERGKKVKIIGRGRPLRVYFDERSGGYISDVLLANGAEITIGKSVSRINKRKQGVEVHCAEGDVFKTDLLVSCMGVAPRLSFLNGSGIGTDQGILVDGKMRTNIEGIYAAGDIAEARSALDNRPGVSAILPNAIAQGKIAGANMAGKECDYEGWLSMNVLKMFGNSAFSIGMAIPKDGEGEILEEQDDGKKTAKRLVTRDGKLVGAMFVNVDIDPGVIRYLIEKKIDVGACTDALFAQPRETSRWLMLKNEKSPAI
jgi:phenylglyoxylate dehydrogenase epsilon subunit